MVNRPKAIGTAGETAVVRYARSYGYPHADRQPLRGVRDCGDITFCPGFIGEVKAGDRARTASDTLLMDWLCETTLERANANADMALLVVARWRQPIERWLALMWAADVATLSDISIDGVEGGNHTVTSLGTPVRLLLRDALSLTRAAGYGVPLDNQQPALGVT